MTTLIPLWLQNLAAISVQVTLVTAAAAALAWAIRLGIPKARLAYWQIVLLICLVLPAAQPWKPLEPVAAPQVSEARELTPLSICTIGTGPHSNPLAERDDPDGAGRRRSSPLGMAAGWIRQLAPFPPDVWQA